MQRVVETNSSNLSVDARERHDPFTCPECLGCIGFQVDGAGFTEVFVVGY